MQLIVEIKKKAEGDGFTWTVVMGKGEAPTELECVEAVHECFRAHGMTPVGSPPRR
jgi:hypothetical protein